MCIVYFFILYGVQNVFTVWIHLLVVVSVVGGKKCDACSCEGSLGIM